MLVDSTLRRQCVSVWVCHIQLTLSTSAFFWKTFIGASMHLNNCLAQAIRPAIGGRLRGTAGLFFSVWYMIRTFSSTWPYDDNAFIYLAVTSNWQASMFSNFSSSSRYCSVYNNKSASNSRPFSSVNMQLQQVVNYQYNELYQSSPKRKLW